MEGFERPFGINCEGVFRLLSHTVEYALEKAKVGGVSINAI